MKATMENPLELAKKIQKQQETVEEDNQQPVPTAMEMALREAMERSQDEEVVSPSETATANKGSKNNQELDGILSRTLNNKVKS